MENSLFVALSRQKALNSQMDVMANNIANMSTPGYQGEKVVFREFLQEPDNNQRDVHQVLDFGTYRNVQAGSMQTTGNPFDFALQGPGYFRIETAEGIQYTRGGSFIVNNEGILVNSRGDAVLDNGNAPIQVPEDAGLVRVTGDGSMAGENGVFAQIGVAAFNAPQFMTKSEQGYLQADNQNPLPADDTSVVQGMLERSNVDPIAETAGMIDVLRSYQSVQQTVEGEHQRQLTMIRELSGQS